MNTGSGAAGGSERGNLVVRAHQMRRGHRSGAGSPRVQCRWAHLKRDFQALIDSGDHQAKRLGHDLMRLTRRFLVGATVAAAVALCAIAAGLLLLPVAPITRPGRRCDKSLARRRSR